MIAFCDLPINSQNNKDNLPVQYENFFDNYYIIGAGDILKIIFFGAPEFSSSWEGPNDRKIYR